VAPADVVAELAAWVKAPDRAARRVPGQYVALDEADGRDAPQQRLVTPGVHELSRAVENLDLADLARVYRAIARHRHRMHRLGSGPSPPQPAACVEQGDLGVVGRIEITGRVDRDAAQRSAELARSGALAADNCHLPVLHPAHLLDRL